MTPADFKLQHLSELSQKAAVILTRPEELCPRTISIDILKHLPKLISQSSKPDSKQIMTIGRKQLPSLLHAWIYIQQQEQDFELNHIAANIEYVLLERINPSLLLQVWICYQHYYNLPAFTRLLISLTKIKSAKAVRPFYIWLREIAIKDDDTIEPVVELHTLAVSEQAQEICESFWQTEQLQLKYPLINEYSSILFPDSSIKLDYELLRNRPLCSLMTALDIVPDSPFLLDFLIRYFTEADDDKILSNINIWLYALNTADSEKQVALAQSFLSSFRLETKWLTINRAVQNNTKTTDLLSKLDHKARVHFKQWQLIDKLNHHIGDQNRKKLFYRDFRLQLREIIDWSENMKIIKLTDFVLADSNDEPEQLWYIDNNTYQLLEEGDHQNILYFENGREILTARDLSLSNSGENIVKLKLDEVNILYARDFMKLKMANKK